MKELELAMNKRMLKHRLVRGSGTSAKMESKMEAVGAGLDRRASLEELKNQGIFQVASARVCVAFDMRVRSSVLLAPYVQYVV